MSTDITIPSYRDPAHYLKALRSTTTPRRLLWLDCVGLSKKEQGAYVERWQHGALGTTHWTAKNKTRRDTMRPYTDADQLWDDASAYCTTGRRVVLFAYDLAYQLRVSQALVHLPQLGWSLSKIVLERTAAWALFRNDDRTLLCCDLKAWTPVDLGKIKADLELTGYHYQGSGAGREFWGDVCKTHASIVRDAVIQILDWIDGENLGPFRPTGSGQSYSAYRRKFMHDKLLVHDDRQRLSIERVAMHTGRCEAWQHGKLTDGPYVEYDMHAAYCHIAHECQVPTVATRDYANISTKRLESLMQRYSVMAEIQVNTDVECVPTNLAGRTVWPTGTFRTVLWDPELQLALRYANSVKVERAWCYQRAPALSEFAGWVLDGLGDQTQVYGLVPQRVLKHWSRCLVGRLGLRYRSWQRFGSQSTADLRLVTLIDVEEGTSTDMLIAGYDRLILSALNEATESLPQIPGWVMSECRRRLWDAMVSYGLSRVVYIDTDSIVLDMHNLSGAVVPGYALTSQGFAVKGTYSTMTIHGPRNLVCESDRRVSGLPKTARQTAPLEFSGQVMRSIKESMRAGELDCITTLPRTFTLDAPDLRREHHPYGLTKPYRLEHHG